MVMAPMSGSYGFKGKVTSLSTHSWAIPRKGYVVPHSAGVTATGRPGALQHVAETQQNAFVRICLSAITSGTVC